MGSGKAFTDTTPEAKSVKENNDKLDFIKIKHLSSSRGTIRKMKRQVTESKKIFANQVSDTELVFR